MRRRGVPFPEPLTSGKRSEAGSCPVLRGAAAVPAVSPHPHAFWRACWVGSHNGPLKTWTMADKRCHGRRGRKAEGNRMAYTTESLAQLSDRELDDVIAAMVLHRAPAPGWLQRLKRGAVRRFSRSADGECPAYSSSPAGMGLVIAGMLAKGLTVAVAPGGSVWLGGAGREITYVGGVAMPRAVAIAAVLAVQGQ